MTDTEKTFKDRKSKDRTSRFNDKPSGKSPANRADFKRDDRRDSGFKRDDRRNSSFKRDDRRDSGFKRDDRRDGGNFRGRKQFAGNSTDRERTISSRRGAFYLLEAVLIDKRPLDFTEHNILKQVPPRDRGLTRMIAYTALRHNAQLDAMIDHFVDDAIGTPQVRVFLKVGMTQILFMETPEHAAVNETLNAVFGKSEPSKGMMNAILKLSLIHI